MALSNNQSSRLRLVLILAVTPRVTAWSIDSLRGCCAAKLLSTES